MVVVGVAVVVLLFARGLTLVLLLFISSLRLLIDDQVLRRNQRLPSFSSAQQSLRMGGGYFEGCISNVFVQRWGSFLSVVIGKSQTTSRVPHLSGY